MELWRAFLKIWQEAAPPHERLLLAPARMLKEARQLRPASIAVCRKSVLRKDSPIEEIKAECYPEDGFLLARLPRLADGAPGPSRELWLLSSNDRLLFLSADSERIERTAPDAPPIRIWQASPAVLCGDWADLWPQVRQIVAWLLILPSLMEFPDSLFETEGGAVTFFAEIIQDEKLLYALQTQGITLKNALPKALNYIVSAETLAPITALIEHPESAVRRCAAAVVTSRPPESILGPLIQAAADPERTIRQEALMSLQNCTAPDALDAVRARLEDEFWWIRAQAARILGKAGTVGDIEVLKALWEDSDPEDVRRTVPTAAQEAVARIKERQPRVDGGEGENRLNAGIAALANGDPAGAVMLLREAIAEMPNEANAYAYLGAACLRSERLVEALAAFERAAQLCPDTASHHYNLGVAYQRLGRLYEARVSFQSASHLGHAKAQQCVRALTPRTSVRAF
ncbi:MAG: HEAT repeat domain-containing protein [Armatimonadetes bacterium]|nr:HEAT repeat domain-containing protein [Armatimonadota bacterium]